MNLLVKAAKRKLAKINRVNWKTGLPIRGSEVKEYIPTANYWSGGNKIKRLVRRPGVILSGCFIRRK